MKKPPAPTAPVRLANTGEVIETGIVLLSKLAQLTFDTEVSQTGGEKTKHLDGELRIVKLTFGWKKYEVQMNGRPIFTGSDFTRFEKLSEAAEWAGF
tara:strand:- start:24 stop:314 length:291 start_codon:yes stop_codon:yes gene_type:complete